LLGSPSLALVLLLLDEHDRFTQNVILKETHFGGSLSF